MQLKGNINVLPSSGLFGRTTFLLVALLELSEILEKHTFVGIVDLNKCLSLIQHSTKLYLVNHGALAYVVTLLAPS